MTDSLAREQHPGKRNSLDALCERYGVSNAHRTLHGALLDAGLLAEAFLAMTRGQDSLTIDVLADDMLLANFGSVDLSRLDRRGGGPTRSQRTMHCSNGSRSEVRVLCGDARFAHAAQMRLAQCALQHLAGGILR